MYEYRLLLSKSRILQTDTSKYSYTLYRHKLWNNIQKLSHVTPFHLKYPEVADICVVDV